MQEGRRRQSLWGVEKWQSLGRELENSETVAKQKKLPSASLDSMCAAHTQKTTLVLFIIRHLGPEGIFYIKNFCDCQRLISDGWPTHGD